MKKVTQHNFTDKYAYEAAKRLNQIMADGQKSSGQKMVGLMLEAQEMCKHQIPLPTKKEKPNLFSELPPEDPYALCVTYFTQTLEQAKKNKQFEHFHPAQVLTGQKGSVLSCAYKIKQDDGKKYPELKNFLKQIKESFPQEMKEQAKDDERAEQEDRYQRSLEKDYKSGKVSTEAFKIFGLDLSPNYRYMLLMFNAARALKETPEADLKDPHYNKELIASLYLTGSGKGTHKKGNMLNHIFSGVVQPNHQARHPTSPNKHITPMQYAEELSQIPGLEDLGTLFTNRLVEHGEKLELSKKAPQVFQQGHKKKRRPS